MAWRTSLLQTSVNTGASLLTEDIAIQVENLSKLHCTNLFMASRYAVLDMFRLPSSTVSTPIPRNGEYFVLEGIDFAVRKNEFFGILGAPRSGKTTLAAVLGGLYPPTSGTVTTHARPVFINRLGSGFRPMLSLFENARFKAALTGIRSKDTHAYIENVLHFADLQKQSSQPLFNLSPHEVRRFGLALALMAEGEILIYDNLTFSGSPAFRDQCMRQLAAHKSNRTVIFIAQKPNILRLLSDRILILENGASIGISRTTTAIEKYDKMLAITREEDRLPDSIMEEPEELEPEEDSTALPEPTIKKIIAMSVLSIEIDGKTQNPEHPYYFWLEQGERLTFSIKLLCNENVRYSETRINLHSSFVTIPIAERRISAEEIVKSPNPFVQINWGEVVTLSFDIIVPELPSNLFGLTISFVRSNQTEPRQSDIFKIMHFGIKGSHTTGRSLVLPVENFLEKFS